MWFWWGLLSAFFGAISTIYVKHSLKKISPLLITWAIIIIPIPILFLLYLSNPISNLNTLFWVGVSGSALFFTFSKLWSTQSIQTELLSKLSPLSSFGALFVYVLGLIFLKEQITVLSLAGILCIIAGAYFLNVETAKENIFQPILILFKKKESALYILAMLFGAITAIFDKTALNNTTPSNPIFTYLMENVVTVIPFSLYLLKNEFQAFSKIKTHFWTLLIVGVIYALSVITLFYAFISGPIVLSTALRQTQIIMIMIMGFFIFSDKPPKHVWLATLIMIMGVVLLKIG